MAGTYPGRIVLADGDEVDVDLQMGSGKVRLATPFAEIGSWNLESVEFSPSEAGGYDLTVGDDVVAFHPFEPNPFFRALSDELQAVGIDPPDVAPDTDAHPGNGRRMHLVADAGPADDQPAPPTHDTPEPAAAVEEPEVHAFGPSSSERLSRATEQLGVRESLEDDQGPADLDPTEEAEQPVERRTSTGFVIPGDPGYEEPTGDPLDDEPAPAAEASAVEASAVETADEEPSTKTVADDVIASQRTLRGASTLDRLPSALGKKIAIGVGVVGVVAALAFGAPVMLGMFASDAEQPVVAETVPVTTSPPTTEPAPVVEPEPVVAEPTAFEIRTSEFVERWNAVAGEVSPALRFNTMIPVGDFEIGFTEWIAIIGAAGDGDGLDSFTIEVDPNGPTRSDQLGIQALGVAIAVADPQLEPSERGELLARMGLDVRNPILAGLDGRVSRNGLNYRLTFDEEAVRLFLTVSG